MGKSRDPDITSIGVTVDKLGVDEGGVEHLVFLRENLTDDTSEKEIEAEAFKKPTWYPTCR